MYIKELTAIEPTGDEEADKAARAAALELGLAYQAEERNYMNDLRKAAKDIKEALGDADPAYLAASGEYYRQRAIYEQVE